MVTLATSLFANTGLVLLLASADFKGTPLSWIPLFSNGQYSDYQNEWYLTVGRQIVVTMIINSFTPQVNFIASYIFRFLKKWKDGGLNRKKHDKKDRKTKFRTIYQYVKCYAGPQVELHQRYASIMNLVFVSFFHGISLPILFPITLFGLINFYVTEKLLFAYYY